MRDIRVWYFLRAQEKEWIIQAVVNLKGFYLDPSHVKNGASTKSFRSSTTNDDDLGHSKAFAPLTRFFVCCMVKSHYRQKFDMVFTLVARERSPIIISTSINCHGPMAMVSRVGGPPKIEDWDLREMRDAKRPAFLATNSDFAWYSNRNLCPSEKKGCDVWLKKKNLSFQ